MTQCRPRFDRGSKASGEADWQNPYSMLGSSCPSYNSTTMMVMSIFGVADSGDA